MRWTDEVSAVALGYLFAAAEAQGVDVTGTCRGVFRYARAR